MYTITQLQPQKRNKQRVSVYLDGAFAFGLPSAVAADLRVGQTLTDDAIETLQGAATIEVGKQYVYKLISYRPRSTAEIRRKMRDKQYDDAVIDTVIEALTERKIIDDLAFANYWIEQREIFKPRSHMALAQELRAKGVEREIIDRALGTVDEESSARRAAEQRAHRWIALPEDQFRLKLGRYLQARGFNYGIIKQISTEIWQAENESNSHAEEHSD